LLAGTRHLRIAADPHEVANADPGQIGTGLSESKAMSLGRTRDREDRTALLGLFGRTGIEHDAHTGSDIRESASRITDGRITAGRITDGRIADGRITAGRITDGRITDGRITDGRIADGRIADG